MTASLPVAPSTYSGTTIYGYDNRNELTQETRTGSGAGNYSNVFAYDSAENPQVFRSRPATGANTFNADNQTTSFTGTNGSSVGTFGYDGNGNPTTYKGSTLAFDPENRMTGYGSVLTNGYGPDDLRAWKQGASGATYFLYSNRNQPVCEFNASGTLTATNTYGHAGLVSRRAGSTSTFYTFDPQGSVAQRLNSNGGIVSSATGDAFGSRATTGSGDVFGYIGQWGYYSDSETGLCLCQHRHYDPATGRFVTRDPIGYAGGINLYNYCRNNSANAADPSGYDEGTTGVIDGLTSCFATSWGDSQGRGTPNGCAALGACIGAAVVTVIEVAIALMCPEGDLLYAGIEGCLVDALGAQIASAVTDACNNQNTCCPDPPKPCQLTNQLEQVGLSCIEGFTSPYLEATFGPAISFAMDRALDGMIGQIGGENDTDCGG